MFDGLGVAASVAEIGEGPVERQPVEGMLSRETAIVEPGV